MPREAHDAEERDYENRIALETARQEALDQDTDYFIKYELTPDFIGEWLYESPESLHRELHGLLLGGDDHLIGQALRRYLWRMKREELDNQ